tara:strand:- start:614 stop:910 length:297 start_codon:yes stop_codon:yes gene_type:complete
MVYHTINEYYMKKISDFIPNKVIKKKKHIDELSDIFIRGSDSNIQSEIQVINYSDTSVTIECNNSSVASIIKFNREKYLKIFKNYGLYNIQDIKIKLK